MITKENLIKAAEDIYENIKIKFVEDVERPYWDIRSVDPDEIDEYITVAKLYYDNFDLEIVGPYTRMSDPTLELEIIYNEGAEIIKAVEDHIEFLEFVVDAIQEEATECISYNEILLDYFK